MRKFTLIPICNSVTSPFFAETEQEKKKKKMNPLMEMIFLNLYQIKNPYVQRECSDLIPYHKTHMEKTKANYI